MCHGAHDYPSRRLWYTIRMRLSMHHLGCLVVILGFTCSTQHRAFAQGKLAGPTTAWQAGHFAIDTAGLLSRSDIVMATPNTLPAEAMPMGNGRLGVAVWAANGLTAQLNRADTLPHRDSPGQLVIPGLAALTSAKDFSARLDLYNGTLVEQGGGIRLTAYVQTSTDTFVVDVTGADPDSTQTAELHLWEPRTPKTLALGKVGMLSQGWTDTYGPGASGKAFGSLAAITADGRDVTATVTSSLSVTVTFRPTLDGHFRVIVAAPHFDGLANEKASIGGALANTGPEEHSAWWHHLWHSAGLIKLTSADGSGEYIETLRNLYLYTAAAESGDRYPGSQAGIADLFSAVQDVHRWDPAAYWHWNLRMQVAANLAAGLYELNAPYFRLYRENLANIQAWTTAHMAGRPGICVPETMRFNGQGFEYEADGHTSAPPIVALNCAADSRPYYNARTLSTGSEISLWIWQHYLASGDRSFLAANYPVMAASARFWLAYETPGADGKKHTHPSNAHEQQWDTTDPTTDLSARSALFPLVMQAAALLKTDGALVHHLAAELSKIPPLPQVEKQTAAGRQSVIAESYDSAAVARNEENVGLEPVWPYNLIGLNSPMLALARQTYALRPYPVHQDWSFDPVQAARLGLGSEVRSTLIALTEKYQTYVNGFANWGGPAGEFYGEQQGIVALALAEALVQDYDGTIYIAPAVPALWDFDGSVWIRDRTRVDVQVHTGVPTTVVIEAGKTDTLHIQNPWRGSLVVAVSKNGKRTLGAGEMRRGQPVFALPVVKGESYLLRPSSSDRVFLPFAPITGTQAVRLQRLGKVQIGK